MFTGLIEQIGTVVAVESSSAGAKLSLDIGPLAREVKSGGSVAVNGVCLSSTGAYGSILSFDVVYETLSRTNLGQLTAGQGVNVELPLRLTDRIEGHFVQGHVDTTCRIARWQEQGTGRLLTLELDDPAYVRYVIPKGSVALDGISLTVATVSDRGFSIALIPATLQRTTLLEKSVGAKINFEADILVKTVVSRQEQIAGSDTTLMDTLKRSGFVT